MKFRKRLRHAGLQEGVPRAAKPLHPEGKKPTDRYAVVDEAWKSAVVDRIDHPGPDDPWVKRVDFARLVGCSKSHLNKFLEKPTARGSIYAPAMARIAGVPLPAPHLDADLVAVMEAWPRLEPPDKAAALQLIRTLANKHRQ